MSYTPMTAGGCQMYVETEGPNAGLYYDTSGKGLCSDAECTDCQVPNDNKTPGPIVYDTQCRSMDFVGIGPGVLAPSWNFIKGDCPVQPVTGPICRVTYAGADCQGNVLRHCCNYLLSSFGTCQV